MSCLSLGFLSCQVGATPALRGRPCHPLTKFSSLSTPRALLPRCSHAPLLLCSSQPREGHADFHRILSFPNLPSPPQAKPDPSAQTSRPPHKARLLRVSSSAFTPSPASPRRQPRPSPPFRSASSSDAQSLGARQGFDLRPRPRPRPRLAARRRPFPPARAREPRPPVRGACALSAAPPRPSPLRRAARTC